MLMCDRDILAVHKLIIPPLEELDAASVYWSM